MRTNAKDAAVNVSAKWLFRYNIAENAITISQWGKTGESVYADIFYKVPGTYARAEVIQVAGDRSWTLVASSEVADTTSSDAKTSVECYKDIASAGTALHGKAYTQTVESSDALEIVNGTPTLTWSTTSTIGSVNGKVL
jgi:hypothetical protein